MLNLIVSILLLSFQPVLSQTVKPNRELGIVRSNLVWAGNTATQNATKAQADILREKIISDISNLGAKWFRDGFSSPTHGVSDFVNLVENVKKNKMKILVPLLPSAEDYPSGFQNSNRGEEFRKRCGWEGGSYPLSAIDLSRGGRYENRLRAQFDAIKSAGLDLDAFEVGNEFDWVCFNGDIPFGRDATEAELHTMAVAYANFLELSVAIIREAKYFPNATILTFGMANIDQSSAEWRKNNKIDGYYIKSPAQFISRLKNLNGKNYLSYVNAYATHVYPDSASPANDGAKIILTNMNYLNDKPFWITEWGFQTTASNRSALMEAFLNMLDSTFNKSIGPALLYAYESAGEHFGLIDSNGVKTPEYEWVKNKYNGYLLCQAGAYSQAGWDKCLSCPAGSTSQPGSSSCYSCNPGTYSQTGWDKCLSCSPGSYAQAGWDKCLSCPAGSYAQAGWDKCLACPAGSYAQAGWDKCLACPTGSYSNAGWDRCLPR